MTIPNQNQYPVAMDLDSASGMPMPKVSSDITQVDAIVPVDVQNHLTSTTVALNAVALTVSTGATPTTTSSSIACDGFNEISVLSTSSVSHTGAFTILWSFDNTNFNINETVSGDKTVNNTTTQFRYGTVPVRAPYCKIYFANNDATNAPTVTAYTYLKA